MREGLAARVTADAYPGRSFDAKVERIAAVVAPRPEHRSTPDQVGNAVGPRAQRARLSMIIDTIGIRPTGAQSDTAHIVRVAVEAGRVLGFTAPTGASSTDANLPISIGVPAISIDGGGRGSGSHSLAEWYEDGPTGWLGPQWAALIVAVRPRGDGETLVELQSTFTPTSESLELGRTNFGFLAVRVAKSISKFFGGGELRGLIRKAARTETRGPRRPLRRAPVRSDGRRAR